MTVISKVKTDEIILFSAEFKSILQNYYNSTIKTIVKICNDNIKQKCNKIGFYMELLL